MNRLLAVALMGTLSSGCVMSFDLAGGPRHVRTSLSAKDVLEELEPQVKASTQAMAKLSSVRTRARVGNVLMYSGLGLLVPCIAVPAFSSRGLSVGSGVAMAASCGGTIVLELIALAVLPKLGTYGDILQAFNSEFPQTPYSSVSLGVEAPSP